MSRPASRIVSTVSWLAAGVALALVGASDLACGPNQAKQALPGPGGRAGTAATGARTYPTAGATTVLAGAGANGPGGAGQWPECLPWEQVRSYPCPGLDPHVTKSEATLEQWKALFSCRKSFFPGTQGRDYTCACPDGSLLSDDTRAGDLDVNRAAEETFALVHGVASCTTRLSEQWECDRTLRSICEHLFAGGYERVIAWTATGVCGRIWNNEACAVDAYAAAGGKAGRAASGP